MVRIRPFLSSVMAMALLSSSAVAADKTPAPKIVAQQIKVRGSDKDNYSRVVFDWGQVKSVPKYTTQESSNRLVITFADDVSLQSDGAPLKTLSRIADYKITSPHEVEIDFAEGQNIRHFQADNRLIIDIKGDAKKPDESAPKPEEKKTEAKKTEDAKSEPVNLASKIESAEKTIKEKLADKKEVIVDAAPAEAQPDEKASAEAQPPQKTYHISLTSTSAVPLAVFKRNGYLWFVQGKENVKIPPQITSDGGDKDKADTAGEPFGKFEPVVASGGISAFRIKFPENMNVVASGSGLVWKLDLTNQPQKTYPPVPFKRIFEKQSAGVEPKLLWPASVLNRVVEMKDPDVGDTLTLAMVESAKDYTGAAQSFVDFDALPSYVGLAVLPKADDLKIVKQDDGVLFTKNGGMNIAPESDAMTARKSKDDGEKAKNEDGSPSAIFKFKDWNIGTKQELSSNQRLLMSSMSNQTDAKKAEGLIDLAKLSLSFNYAPEALGYLELAQSFVPELESNPEFMALMGAADSLSWKPKEAYALFSNASLNDIGEIPYWRAYTLAKLDDWQQAAKILPDDTSILSNYTDDVKIPFTLTLAEIALREGNIAKAKKLMDVLEPLREHMELPYASAYDYLQGEFDRQMKMPTEAKELWKTLSEGRDDLYRAKAKYALTMMQLDAKEITEDKAVDNLEGLRYAWRGDDLEVSINNNLAKIYLMKNEPVKALTLMDLAHSLNPQSDMGKKIDEGMRDAFKAQFTPENIKKLSPVDVLILYSEFSKLAPSGAEGEELTRQLAERMANADLLPRAIALLKKQVDGTLQGLEGATVAIRLATLQNMDAKPDDALASLNKAETLLKGLPSADVLSKQQDIGLLRAKAYSLKGKPDDAFAALSLLPQNDDTLRLRADIAWRGKKWQDAADSLEQLVQNQNITLTRPLTDEQADLLLNWGVALYLADNRYVLANLRERYSDAMAATTKAQKFEVVTRPRQASLLADKETINSIIDETTIFKDFLTSFKSSDTPSVPSVIPNTPVDASSNGTNPANVPENLRNASGLKTDEVLGD